VPYWVSGCKHDHKGGLYSGKFVVEERTVCTNIKETIEILKYLLKISTYIVWGYVTAIGRTLTLFPIKSKNLILPCYLETQYGNIQW
jgi:hypothetical protein